MGRRKIEIQPIAQDRNRSVTFLKRKNGLFKKAYELGVLCSVDVAVIIFETRPGQDPKLHQYCSTDIRNVVQRHIHHRGEKDIKVPGDFSGAGGATTVDDGDDQEAIDDDQADEEEHSSRMSKRKRSGGLTVAEVVNTNENGYFPPGNQYLYSTSAGYPPQVPPPPPMHAVGRADSSDIAGMGSLLPVSNDRVSNLRESHSRLSKRQRRTTFDSMNPDERSPVLQPGGRNISPMSDRPPTEQYDSDQQEKFYPQIRASPFLHDNLSAPYQYHAQHSMHHHGFNPNPSYTPMYSGYAQSSTPPSFIPLNSDIGPLRDHPLFTQNMGPTYSQSGNGAPMAPRDGEGRFNDPPPPQYDPALLHAQNTMVPPRHSPHEIPSGQRTRQGSDDQGNKKASFIFETHERKNNRSKSGDGGGSDGGGSGSIEWPSYRHGHVPPITSSSLRGNFRSRNSTDHDAADQSHPGSSAKLSNKGSWLDVFSPADAGNTPHGTTTSRLSTSGGKSRSIKGEISRDRSDSGARKPAKDIVKSASRGKRRKDGGANKTKVKEEEDDITDAADNVSANLGKSQGN